MFGKVRHHFRRQVALGNGVAKKVQSAYDHGAKIVAGVDKLVGYGRELYDVASPFISQFAGQKGQAIMDRGAQQAFGGYDKFKGQVREKHDDVMDRIRAGGVMMDKMREVEAPTQMYSY